MANISKYFSSKIESMVANYSALVFGLVALFFAVFIFGMVTAPNFLTLFNLKTIVRDAALVGIMAIGLTFVTLSGNFFLLSLKETAALTIIAFATSMSAGYGFEISFIFTMAIAVIAGGAQGVLIGLGGNPIVVTLGAAGLLYGLGAYWSDNLVVSFRRPHGRVAWDWFLFRPSKYYYRFYPNCYCCRAYPAIY